MIPYEINFVPMDEKFGLKWRGKDGIWRKYILKNNEMLMARRYKDNSMWVYICTNKDVIKGKRMMIRYIGGDEGDVVIGKGYERVSWYCWRIPESRFFSWVWKYDIGEVFRDLYLHGWQVFRIYKKDGKRYTWKSDYSVDYNGPLVVLGRGRYEHKSKRVRSGFIKKVSTSEVKLFGFVPFARFSFCSDGRLNRVFPCEGDAIQDGVFSLDFARSWLSEEFFEALVEGHRVLFDVYGSGEFFFRGIEFDWAL